MTALPPKTVSEDLRDPIERLYFARGVLDILKGTGLFNFLIERAIADLDAVAAEIEKLPPSVKSI